MLSRLKSGLFPLLSGLILIFCGLNAKAQSSGDYGAVTSGTWATASIWKIYNGVSWASSPLAGAVPLQTHNVYILSGISVTLTVSQTPCNNLVVESGGKLWTNSGGSNTYLYVYGNITCNGTIGNGATFDAISFGIEGANCLWTGTGSVNCSRIRKNNSMITTTNLVVDININLLFATGSQTQIYNSANSTTFNVTVNAGRTLSLTGSGGNVGNVAIDGISANDPAERGGKFTVLGTLLVSGTLYLTTNNSTLPCQVDIGPAGIIQTASVIANSSGAARHTFNMQTGGLLQITGTPFTNQFFLSNNIYTFAANSTIEYSATGVQNIDNNLTYVNLKTSGSGNKTANGALTITGNLNITGSSIVVPNSTTPFIYLAGDWTDYGAAGFLENAPTSTVVMIGSANQNITCPGGELFANLIINKAGGKVYSASAPSTILRVSGILDLIAGNVVSGSNNYVYLLAGASVGSVSNASFVEGLCAKQGNTAFVFPIGKDALYRPLGTSGPASASNAVFAEYFHVDPDPVPYSVNSKDITIDHVSRCEYWLVRASASNNLQITLSWDSYSCGVTNPSNLLVAAWLSAQWTDKGSSSTTGTLAQGTVTASSTTTIASLYIPFTLASTTTQNPLPITLMDFTGKQLGDKVLLSWITQTEVNNDYFTVQRSCDGIDFTDIEIVPGSGNSSNVRSYQAVDENPCKGLSYYRLKQTDFDGAFSISQVIIIKSKAEKADKISLFPNPAMDRVSIQLPKAAFSNAHIRLFDIQGRQILSQELSSMESLVNLDLNELPLGVLHVMFEIDGDFYSERLIHVK